MSTRNTHTTKKGHRNASISNWHGLKQGNLLDYMERISTGDNLSPSEIFATLAQVNRKATRVMPTLPEEPQDEEPQHWWMN